MKIDAGGHEGHVRAGMDRTLALPGLRALVLKVHYPKSRASGRVPDGELEMRAKRAGIASTFERHGFQLGSERAEQEGEFPYAHLLFSRP